MGQRCLVVAAHADDFELNATSFLSRYEVHVLIVAAPGQVRAEEVKEAAALLKYGYSFLELLDGYLYETDFRNDILNLMHQYKPQILVTHDPWKRFQLHPDHREVGFQTVDSIAIARVTEHHVPEELFLWKTDEVNIINYLRGGEYGRKLGALECYASQPIILSQPIPTRESFHRIVLEEEFG